MQTSASRTGLLSGLPQHISTLLFSGVSRIRLSAGEQLFLAGDAGDGCYRVESGLLKVTILSLSGDERILAFLGAGSLVGEFAMLDGLPRSASVFAMRDTELVFIARARFDSCAQDHPEIYQHLVRLLVHRLRETDKVVATQSFLSLRGRLGTTLVELASHFGKDVAPGRILIQHKFSQSEFAAMSGIARENVSRILAVWRKQKLVSRLSGYYCLDDIAALRREIFER